MKNPSIGEARSKLIRRIQLKSNSSFKEAETIADGIHSGLIEITTLKDKVAIRHATILLPSNWVECTGEAHQNLYIDHCGSCLPNWGKVWKHK